MIRLEGAHDKTGYYIVIYVRIQNPILYSTDIVIMWVDNNGAQLPFISVPMIADTGIDLTPVKRVVIDGVDMI